MPLAFSMLVPSTLVPSAVNVTLPVGASVLVPDTVAVKVTDAPTVIVGELAESVVVVVAWLIVSLKMLEVDVALVASPEYCAVRLCIPGVSAAVGYVATPPALRFALPI